MAGQAEERIHAVAGSDQMLVGGGGAPQEAQQVSDTNSHQPIMATIKSEKTIYDHHKEAEKVVY